jgi:hypothetical protein
LAPQPAAIPVVAVASAVDEDVAREEAAVAKVIMVESPMIVIATEVVIVGPKVRTTEMRVTAEVGDRPRDRR